PLTPISPLFPYTTLFRSSPAEPGQPLRHSTLVWRLVRRQSFPASPFLHCGAQTPFWISVRIFRFRLVALKVYLSRFCPPAKRPRSEEHTSELQSRENLVC